MSAPTTADNSTRTTAGSPFTQAAVVTPTTESNNDNLISSCGTSRTRKPVPHHMMEDATRLSSTFVVSWKPVVLFLALTIGTLVVLLCGNVLMSNKAFGAEAQTITTGTISTLTGNTAEEELIQQVIINHVVMPSGVY